MPEATSSWKPEYFVTRYIADVARLLKFEGILYSSVTSNGNNLVLFNPRHKGVQAVDSPKVFRAPLDQRRDLPF